MEEFRIRVAETAARVEERTGIDPLDLDRSIGVTTDARLERLPGAIGFGLGAMGVATAIACVGFLSHPDAPPGTTAAWVFVLMTILLLGGAVACQIISRVARQRRPEGERYEDAWARFAVEIWPAQRYRNLRGADVVGAGYSRTEFLLALRRGSSLDGYSHHPPFTRISS